MWQRVWSPLHFLRGPTALRNVFMSPKAMLSEYRKEWRLSGGVRQVGYFELNELPSPYAQACPAMCFLLTSI